jgi:hypothetical protein
MGWILLAEGGSESEFRKHNSERSGCIATGIFFNIFVFWKTQIVEEACCSETSVIFYKTIQCNIPQDRHLHICRRITLRSLAFT